MNTSLRTPKSRGTPKSRATSTEQAEATKPDLWFHVFLTKMLQGKSLISLHKGGMIYAQGEPADAVYFVEHGKVRLSVLSQAGREAILGILTPGDFCGEGCLAGQTQRVGTATALSPVVVNKVLKEDLVQAFHEQHPLSEAFLTQLLARNIAIEEDICDQLFNHSEKRLARALLKLARFGQETPSAQGHLISPRISQEALAEMIGTTRSRVNFFMNKFRRMGLIEYNGEVRVRPELLTDVVLCD